MSICCSLAGSQTDKSLLKAIKQNNTQYILSYLQSGGNPDTLLGRKEFSMLVHAIRYNSPEVLNILLKYGADPDLFIKDRSPLIWAIRRHNYEISKTLLIYGADVNASDSKGSTALIVAGWMNRPELCKLLVNYNADINHKDKHGKTVFDYVQFSKSEETEHYFTGLKNYRKSLDPDEVLFDGPYISWIDDTTVTIRNMQYDHQNKEMILVDDIVAFKGDSTMVKGILNDTCNYWIYRTELPVTDEFSKAEKIFAIDDIHGNFDELIDILKNNGIINDQCKWIWGKGHLVIVGDIFDRGDKVTETLWLLYRLDREARRFGGYVNIVLGNHEIMILRNETLYLSDKYRFLDYYFDSDYSEYYRPSSILGGWIRKQPAILKINNNLFVHGGISKEFYSEFLSLQSINHLTALILDKPRQQLKDKQCQLLNSKLGPFWYRGYVWEVEDSEPITENTINEILSFYRVNHIIVGHTLEKTIQLLMHNKIIAISSHFEEEERRAHGLLIKDQHYYKADFDGKLQLLF